MSTYLPSPTVFDRLLEPIHDVIAQQEQQRFHHHNEKFTYTEFVRLLLYYALSNIDSIALFLNSYLNNGLLSPQLKLSKVPRTTVNEAFERFAPALFRAVFLSLITSVSLQVVPEFAALGLLYCIDGSVFPTLCSMSWAEYRTSCRAVKLHLCFELNRMIPVDICVGTGNSSERQALRQMLTAGVTYIADRGYVCFQLFFDITSASAHFLIRVRHDLSYYVPFPIPLSLPDEAQHILRQVTDQLISCSRDPHHQLFRLITFHVAGTSFFLLTDRLDLTTFQVIVLYASRWQVELLFRFLKRTMGAFHLIHHSRDGVTIYLYVLLIAAVLQLRFKQTLQAQCRAKRSHGVPSDSQDIATDETDSSEELPVFHDLLADGASTVSQLFLTLRETLAGTYKIGIHWLETLRQLLDHPFDDSVIELLGMG
jgi:putative transposase